MNNDDTAGDLAAIIFNALSSSDLPVTFGSYLNSKGPRNERIANMFEHVSGLFFYTTTLDNGFSVSAYFSAVTGEYLACYCTAHCNGECASTEFLAEAIFRKLADRHARQNLPAEVYTKRYTDESSHCM